MKRFDIEVENGRAYLVGNPDGKYVSYSDAVEAADAAKQVQTDVPVALGDAELLTKWEEAYSAFIGAFDTLIARRRMGDDYSSDARDRLFQFDRAFRNAITQKSAVPDGYALVPIEPTREMFKAVDKLDDEMFAGGCAHGANFEQLWEAAILAAPKP